jgi:hypothetical protein
MKKTRKNTSKCKVTACTFVSVRGVDPIPCSAKATLAGLCRHYIARASPKCVAVSHQYQGKDPPPSCSCCSCHPSIHSLIYRWLTPAPPETRPPLLQAYCGSTPLVTSTLVDPIPRSARDSPPPSCRPIAALHTPDERMGDDYQQYCQP